MSKLDELLARIDPVETINGSDERVAHALNSYQYFQSVVTYFDEFELIVGDFYWHVESIMLDAEGKINPKDIIKQKYARQVLNEIYGPHGSATAFSIANTGVEGGLYGIYRKVGEVFARKDAESLIDSEVDDFINEIKHDDSQYEAAIEEYVQKYGQILPQEVTEDDADDIRANFGKALKQHPFLVKRMRELGRI